jgi:diamine N-acetyltransferase
VAAASAVWVVSYEGERQFGRRRALRTNPLELTGATAADIPFIVATERLPGYEELVGRWTETEHRVALAREHYAYFIARVDSQPIGFAIVRDWASRESVTCIKRIAVVQPGQGAGRALLTQLVGRIFRETEAYRIWLGLFPDNGRAQRAYEAVGFKAEGLARGNAFFGGVYRDELIMALLRPEWSTRNAS